MSLSRKLLYSLITLMLVLLVAELWISLIDPKYRIQIVRSGNVEIFETEHGPYWRSNNERLLTGCPDPSDPAVLLVGSSILYGSSTEAADAFGPVLRNELKKIGRNSCVLNLSMPAYTFSTQLAALRSMKLPAAPAVVLWEIWHNSIHDFVTVGETAYNFGLAEGALPDPFGIGTLNKPLLRHSSLYEFLLLKGYNKPNGNTLKLWQSFASEEMPKALEWAKANNASLMLSFFPQASRPFKNQSTIESRTYEQLLPFIAEHSIPSLRLTQTLADERPLLFADKCCHYSVDGTIKVSEQLAVFLNDNWPLE